MIKSFYDELLSVEGDIFQDYPVVLAGASFSHHLRPFKPVQKLKKYMITDVPTDILEEVAEVIASVVRNGVRVDWMDET